jgi:hypothetical protein
VPTPPTPAESTRTRSLLLALLPALAAVLCLGNDGSWDLRNYHLYGPHAWVHGRQAIDIAAAQMQGYHNPLLDLPLYALVVAGVPAKLIGVWLALPAMVSIWCLLKLQERLAPTAPTLAEAGFLALLALTGAATWSTLGLSMNDAFVAAGMLGALVLVLDTPLAPSFTRVFAAGALAGASAGLKLTAAVYCPALALALLFLPGSAKQRGLRLMLLAAGGLLGFLVTYGAWGWSAWQAHGNPFFPYFNDVFRSPDIAARSWMDLRFRPRGPAEALLTPLRLLSSSHRFSEAGLKDPRLLIALAGFATLAWRTRAGADAAQLRALFAFVLAAWLAWATSSGIYRYLIVLELLGALALALFLARLSRWRTSVLVIAFVLVSVDTRRPDWHRVSSAAAVQPVLADGARLPPHSMVVTASGEPLGYLALALPDDVPMLGLANNLVQPGDCAGLPLRAANRLRAHAGPVYLATLGNPRDQQLVENAYGFAAADRACLAVHSAIGDARLCPQHRVAPAPPASSCR